ncbi:hypothetical protein SDC9_193655 [bioreactor metagenome]|uniref:Uncharacterized protein n=1 Tax=bioreactor metagenome TaxID=1076179 RepID=A0A645I450_9ZZZZ
MRGVKGVIWYCWKETGDNTGVEGSGHHPATQQVLKELVAEFKVLAPALMAPGGRMLKSKDGHVHALICGDGETGRYLVYVNADERASDAVLSVPDLAGKTLEGMFGAPEAAIQDGVLKINVPALGTGVFQIK